MIRSDTPSSSLVVSNASQLPVQAFTQQSDTVIPLFVDNWEGKGKNTGRVLLILHGLGEHCGRYRHLADELGDEFDRFYAMDQRGHGRSGGLRGYTPSFGHLREDLMRVASEIQNKEQGKQLYLLAHSFGGLVALSLLLREKKLPFHGAIISAPLLGVTMRVPPVKKMLGEFLARTLSKLQLTNEINPSHLSHDPKVIEAYVKDRLVHDKITPRLYVEMVKEMRWVLSQHSAINAPLLFIVPGADKIVDSKATLSFYRSLKSRDKEVREYPEFFHEPLNELGKEKVFEDIRQWLNKTKASMN